MPRRPSYKPSPDTEWRLLRIPSLESGIYAVRAAMIEAQVFLTFRKDLRNLALQETRLRRQRHTDITELKTLQNQRKESADSEMRKAAEFYRIANKCGGAPFDPELFGFEFTIEQIEDHIGLTNVREFVLGTGSASFSKADFEQFMASHTSLHTKLDTNIISALWSSREQMAREAARWLEETQRGGSISNPRSGTLSTRLSRAQDQQRLNWPPAGEKRAILGEQKANYVPRPCPRQNLSSNRSF